MTKHKFLPKFKQTYNELYKRWSGFTKIYYVPDEGVQSVAQFVKVFIWFNVRFKF